MQGGNLGAGDMGEMMEMQKRYQKLNESGIQRRPTIKQFMHPDQLQHFPVGKDVGVKVDPEDPTVAVP